MPTDRDGNSEMLKGRNNSTRMLAENLAREGIASLRYDKRGVGESKTARGIAGETVFEDLIHDTEGWVETLKADERFAPVIVAGHSEGSLIGMISARTTGAGGYISIAGAGRPIDQVMTQQFRRQPKFLQRANGQILPALRRGERVERVSFLLKKLYKPDNQSFLRSWIGYDPAAEIAKLEVPILLVQGGRDLQAGENDFAALKAARPDAETLYLETMNHVLKECGKGLRKNLATYTRPDLPLAEVLVGGIAEFALATQRVH